MAKPPGWKDDPLRRELLALYGEVDALLAPFTCELSGDCCHFGRTGREPYPTAVELAEVELAARRAGVAVARDERRRLPVAGDEGRCPLLAPDGRCRIYASRPFGCRTFFCERATGPGKLPRREVLRLGGAVAALSARFDPVDPRPRPLVRALKRFAL